MNITITDPNALKAIVGDDRFVSTECRKANATSHKYSIGQECILSGLESFPEYNGGDVVITAIRENGEYGLAYYISGKINEVLNWVYEYRLIKKAS